MAEQETVASININFRILHITVDTIPIQSNTNCKIKSSLQCWAKCLKLSNTRLTIAKHRKTPL